MRLYAIPIVKNRWAYYCHSTIPSTSSLTRAVDWANKKWELLDKAEPDTWKKKLFVKGSSIMNQLDYQEWFFKSVPGKEDVERPLDKVLIHHPSILDGNMLEKELNEVLKTRVPYHKKYMYYSAYWVPISCTFVIVPVVPNIPLAYNLFRLYSHYKAYKGAQHLETLTSYGNLKYVPNEAIDGVLATTQFLDAQDIIFPDQVRQLVEQEKKPNLTDVLGEKVDLEGVLNHDQIKQMVERLQVPGLELELSRARCQILKDIAIERFKQEKQ